MKTLIALFLILSCARTFAAPEDLVQMNSRPTMADLDREVPMGEGAQNPFPHTDHNYPLLYRESAQFIARLEQAMPGAVYMPMGRDMVFLGDVVDAFYRAHGQPGRVIRISMSGASIPSENVKETLEAFMGSLIDIPRLKESPGYMLFDNSWYQTGSQSTRLVEAVYRAYKKSDGDPEEILNKFNAMTVWSGFATGEPDETRADQRENFSSYGYPFPAFKHVKDMSRKTTIYSAEWHTTFGLISTDADGRTAAAVPERNETDIALAPQILHVMWEVRRGVAQPEFLEAVKTEARKFGYEFSLNSACDRAAL